MDNTILVNQVGGVATVTLNRPERKNAVLAPMWDRLAELFRAMSIDETIRVVVLTGAGDEFCSGADLWAPPDGPINHPTTSLRQTNAAVAALHELAQPTIAKVPGVAAGAGCSLALACDLIVASDRARFSEIFAKRGLSLDAGSSWLLPRLIGLHKAKELAFFAEIISAAEADDLGLVNRVVPHEELDAFVDDWAARLAAGPPLALTGTKHLLNNAMEVTMSQALQDEGRMQSINLVSRDTAEAFKAFTEKRVPTFQGR